MMTSKYLFDRVISRLKVSFFICFISHVVPLKSGPKKGVSCASIKFPIIRGFTVIYILHGLIRDSRVRIRVVYRF